MLHVLTMAEPIPFEVVVGDVVRVDVTFSYKGHEQDAVVYAGIGHYGLFGWNAVEPNENVVAVAVDSPDAFKEYSASIFITIAENLSPDAYDVAAYVVGQEAETFVWAEDMVIVAGAPGISEWLGPMMMIMMLGMIAPMLGEGAGAEAEAGAGVVVAG